MEHDIGRPLDHCAHTFVQIDLASDVSQGLRSGSLLEKAVPTHTDTWLLLGILPFLTATDMCEPDPVTTHDGEVLVANAPLTFADAVSIDGADRTPFSPASSHSTSIVEAYSGQIGMTSAPGEGLTFWVTIPKIEMRTMSN